MSKTVMIVDDEPDLLKVMSFGLKMAGYKAITCSNSEQAVELINKEKPDLVLLDLLMPKMSGEDICKIVKSDQKLKHIPVVFLTAILCETKEKIESIGADGYLEKPFEPEKLMEKIKELIGE